MNYQPKEYKFVRKYTCFYFNLGINSTYSGKSNHNLIKSLVDWQLSLAKSVLYIRDYIQDIEVIYDKKN